MHFSRSEALKNLFQPSKTKLTFSLTNITISSFTMKFIYGVLKYRHALLLLESLLL